MEEFIAHVRVLINALGYKVFEPVLQHKKAEDEKDVLYINTGSVKAKRSGNNRRFRCIGRERCE